MKKIIRGEYEKSGLRAMAFKVGLVLNDIYYWWHSSNFLNKRIFIFSEYVYQRCMKNDPFHQKH